LKYRAVFTGSVLGVTNGKYCYLGMVHL